MLKQSTYSEVRPFLDSGDVVAFQGKGFLSSTILKCTGSNVSHVGVIRRVESDRVYVIESTTLKKGAPAGVFTSLLSDRLVSYQGKVWILKLSREARAKFSPVGFEAECVEMDGKKYDTLGVLDFELRKAIGLSLNPFPGHVFCSCLVSYALESAGVLPKSLYPRNESPSDVCALKIYDQDYSQLVGGPEEIRGFNTVQV